MNGVDVMTSCRRFPADMAKLELSYSMAMDAATQISPRLDGSRSRSADACSAPERFAIKAQSLSRRMDARRSMYALELNEAATMLETLPTETANVLYRNMITGKTIKEIAIEMDNTVEAVRARLARGRNALSCMESALDQDPESQQLETQFRQK